jgi:DNA-directed RNA polymerase specialized sigma24 family protein
MDSSVVSKLSDESLLVGLRSGDPDAARDFVRRFQHRVFGLTFSILRDHGAAEEAAQESFVRAWKHASAYDPRRGTVAAWLLCPQRIDQHASGTALRPHRPRGCPRAGGKTATRGRGRRASGGFGALRKPMARLPADQRRALVLAVFYGFTAREIGELDGVPLGTVRTRIRSAMLKLRSQLKVSDDR